MTNISLIYGTSHKDLSTAFGKLRINKMIADELVQIMGDSSLPGILGDFFS